jgi:hypothetical protein
MDRVLILVLPVIIIQGVIHTVMAYRAAKKEGSFSKTQVRYGLISGIILGIYTATVMCFELHMTWIKFLLVVGSFSLFGWSSTNNIYQGRKNLGKK